MQTENTLTIIFLAIIIGSFLFSDFIQSRFKILSQFCGIEFIFFGVIAGSSVGFSWLTRETLNHFTPLVSLLIGLYGFLLGLECAQIKMNKGTKSMKSSLAFFLLVFVASTGFFVAISHFFVNAESIFFIEYKFKLGSRFFSLAHSKDFLFLSSFLGALTTISSSSWLSQLALARGATKSEFLETLSRAAIVSEVVGVFCAGISLSALRALSFAEGLGMTIVEWSLLSVCVGVGCGIFYWFLTTVDRSVDRTYLSTVGIVLLTSGVAYLLGFSLVFLAAICGLIVAFTNFRADKIYEEIKDLRPNLSILILFFAGASLDIKASKATLILAFVYIAVRIITLVIIPVFTKEWIAVDKTTRLVGRSYFPQDVLIVAFALDYSMRGFFFAKEILFTCICGYIFFALFSKKVVDSVLHDLWESRPRFVAQNSADEGEDST